MITVRSGSATDVGRVRAVNEDLAFEGQSIYGVADGMGGHAGGDIAARTAVEAVQAAFSRDPTVDGLLDAVQEANAAVWDRGIDESQLRGMGTTLTVAAKIEEGEDLLLLVNVGDSRAYRLRAGELEQLTTDHSVAEELVNRGELTPSQAALHPQRHILTRALGVAPDVDLDAWDLKALQGDRYLLCSDGLSNDLAPNEMTAILEAVDDPARAAEELVEAANRVGGNDNITAVVLDVVSSDGTGPGSEEDRASDEDLATASQPVPIIRSPRTRSPGSSGASVAVRIAPASTLIEEKGRPAAGASAGTLPAEREAPRRTRSRRVRALEQERKPIVTGRFVIFLAVVIAVVIGAVVVVDAYLGNSYFLSLDGSQIVVEQGKPGGFLWVSPKIVDRTGVTKSEVPSYQVSGLQDGSFTEPSAAAAKQLVRRMVLSKCDYDQGIPGEPTTTTSPAKLPAIARCPSTPTAQVTPPPSTTTSTTSASRRVSGSSTTTSSTGAKG